MHAICMVEARSTGTANNVRRMPSMRTSERRSYSASSISAMRKSARRARAERNTVTGSLECNPTRSAATVSTSAAGPDR